MKALDFPAHGAVAVFGGSGGGGSAICRAFAQAGCDVAFTYHANEAKALDMEPELGDLGRVVHSYQLDLADAGIESLVRQMAWEEAAHGVRANSVGLGWMNFGLGEIGGSERSMLKGELGKQLAAEFASKVPLGHRPGAGEELANAVLFMASKQASYITGQCLVVDGGMSL